MRWNLELILYNQKIYFYFYKTLYFITLGLKLFGTLDEFPKPKRPGQSSCPADVRQLRYLVLTETKSLLLLTCMCYKISKFTYIVPA